MFWWRRADGDLVEDGLYAGYGLKHVKKLIEDQVAGGIALGDDATIATLGSAEFARTLAGSLDLTDPEHLAAAVTEDA